MLQKWLKNTYDAKDNAYETPILTYNRELDVLAPTNSITKSNVDEESSPPYLKDALINLEKEMKNLENTTSMATPQFVMGSNELNDQPMALGSTQYGNAS